MGIKFDSNGCFEIQKMGLTLLLSAFSFFYGNTFFFFPPSPEAMMLMFVLMYSLVLYFFKPYFILYSIFVQCALSCISY